MTLVSLLCVSILRFSVLQKHPRHTNTHDRSHFSRSSLAQATVGSASHLVKTDLKQIEYIHLEGTLAFVLHRRANCRRFGVPQSPNMDSAYRISPISSCPLALVAIYDFHDYIA